jgi:ABC-type uncharacterized transport system substrate-binding protein
MASYKQQMEDMQRQGQELAAARLQQQAAEPDVVANIAQPQAQAAAQAYGPKNAKQQAVVDTFKWAWKGEHALGVDITGLDACLDISLSCLDPVWM